MILGKNLKHYPSLPERQPEIIKQYLPESGECHANQNDLIMNYYAIYLHITETSASDFIKTINSADKLEEFNRRFIGFVITHVERSKDLVIRSSQALLKKIASAHSFAFNKILIKDPRGNGNWITPEIEDCINLFAQIEINKHTLDYYYGWRVTDKEGNTSDVYLAQIHDTYGRDFTKRFHNQISQLLRKLSSQTGSVARSNLVKLFNLFCAMYPTEEILFDAMSFSKQSKSMQNAFNYLVLSAKADNNDINTFVTSHWRNIVYYFNQCFVDVTGWFDEPLFEIETPVFKSGVSKHAIGNNFSKSFKERLLTNIPLSLPDSKAMELIMSKIQADVEHLKFVCDSLIQKTMVVHEQNSQLASIGKVKKFTTRSTLPMGKHNFENVVATFYTCGYQISNKSGGDMAKFFGFHSESHSLKAALNIPTEELLYPFLLRLVLEHPIITPAPLAEWELYDKNGKLTGFRPSGDGHVMEITKKRKGVAKSQQIIKLNDTSKKICEDIVKLTSHARTTLKNNKNSDWRFMLLRARNLGTLPKRYPKGITEISGRDGESWRKAYLMKSPHIQDLKSVQELINNTTLRNARTSAGVIVYLNTKSTTAFTEALGHDTPNTDLIKRYLPKPLYEFFTERWIRIFQNAIIIEAMKNSEYLLDAVDINEEYLEAFIQEHALGELPEQLKRLGEKASFKSVPVAPEQQETLESVVLTVSVPQFQIYLGVISVIESAKAFELISKTGEILYKTGKNLISMIENHLKDQEQRLFRINDDIIHLYQVAKTNPLDLNHIKDLIICR